MTQRFRPLFALVCALSLGVLGAGCDDAKAKRLAAPTRETINQTTQDVRDLQPELAAGGVVTDGKIHSTDYLGVQADAYRTSVGNIAKMKIKMEMDTYEVLNGPIKSYAEFMDLIIKKGKPDGIQLPMLPYYQEYGYDSEKRELVVIEYPEKKKKVEEFHDKELGRK